MCANDRDVLQSIGLAALWAKHLKLCRDSSSDAGLREGAVPRGRQPAGLCARELEVCLGVWPLDRQLWCCVVSPHVGA